MKKEENYYFCNYCDDVKPSKDFRSNSKTRCRECEDRILKERYQLKTLHSIPIQVYKEPNRYHNQNQRDAVSDIMILCGWKFNSEKGIWYKDGIKDKDGNFLNLRDRTKEPKKDKRSKTFDKEQHQVILKRKILDQESIDKIQDDFFIKKVSLSTLKDKYPEIDRKLITYIIQRTYLLIRRGLL